MEIRVVGYIDEVLHVNQQMYEAAETAGTLQDFMHPILLELDIELVFGRAEEFNGNQI